MSERGLNPWIKVLRNFFRSLRPSYMLPPQGRMVGSDHHGNRYFEIQKGNAKPVRFYKPTNVDRWDEPLPPEWNAWLRLMRNDPPTIEEVEKNFQRIQNIKSKMAHQKGNAPHDDDDAQNKQKQASSQRTESGKFPKFQEYEQNPGSKHES